MLDGETVLQTRVRPCVQWAQSLMRTRVRQVRCYIGPLRIYSERQSVCLDVTFAKFIKNEKKVIGSVCFFRLSL